MHSFIKSPRFPTINTNTQNATDITIQSDFDRVVAKGRLKDRHDFGQKQRRFSYMQANSVVGPAEYNTIDGYSQNNCLYNSSKYTFGTAREALKPMHIYAIER